MSTGRTERDTDTGLPASYEIAWGVRDRPTRGPKPGLSLERIVAAAVEVASADGIAAVSMSRVAGELGISAMALYRYVASKDELLGLMADAALGADVELDPTVGWRAGLEGWAWTELAVYRRHPWVLQVPVAGPPVTPNSIRFLEAGLRCLADTGLPEGEKMGVILLVTSYTRSWALLSADLDTAFGGSQQIAADALRDYGRTLAAVTDREHYPALHAVLDAGVFDEEDDDPDYDFVFGLHRVLDGIEVLIDSR